LRVEARIPGPSFRLSTLDCELVALTMSTHATPMFTLTDSASRPEISALDRAGPLEIRTHRKCPPRGISLLEYALTRHRRAPASPLESALTRLLALKSLRFRTYVKHPGGTPPQPFSISSFSYSFSPLRFTFYILPFAFSHLPPCLLFSTPASLLHPLEEANPQQLLRLTWSLCAPRMADSSMNGQGDNRAESHRGPTMRRPCAVLGDTFPMEMRRR